MRYSKFAPDLTPISETDLMASHVNGKRQLEGLRSRSGRSLSTPGPSGGASNGDATAMLQSCRVRPRAASAMTRAMQMNGKPVVDDKYGRTVLHHAVRKGDLEAMRMLVTQHPELLRFPDNRGNHPLHYAANAGSPEGAKAVYLLLKAGAFANAVNDRHQTPLLVYAISTEDDNDLIPRLLLHHNAKPMVQVSDNFLLPQYVASRGLLKIVAALREFM